MSQLFIAEIRMFAGNFAPRGWALCNGQLIPIAQNSALFSLVGTTYGGDGRTTFGLPDLRGRAPMHPGRGPGLSPRQLGQQSGVADVTLTTDQMPQHSHAMAGSSAPIDRGSPVGTVAGTSTEIDLYRAATDTSLADDAASRRGGNQSHNNRQPLLVVNFIIALVGAYPSRG